MTDNVVYVDFAQTKSNPHRNLGLEFYLQALRNYGLDEDDILEINEAIDDVNVYMSADEEIKFFASEWFQQSNSSEELH